VLSSKNDFGNAAWLLTTERDQVEILEKLWNWAKKLKLKQEDLRNEVFLTKDESNDMAWHKAAGKDQVEILEKFCDRAKKTS